MVEDEELPEGLNLKNTNFILSLETLELAQKCFENFKSKEFFCGIEKATVSYNNCVVCKSAEKCTQVKDLERKIEVCEFFLDLEVADAPIKKDTKK